MIPVTDEIGIEADSGGHTDQGVAYALIPAMFLLCDELMAKYRYDKPIKVGAAGDLNVQDAPAGDMFEIGAWVQVAKRGMFFPARANKLHEL